MIIAERTAEDTAVESRHDSAADGPHYLTAKSMNTLLFVPEHNDLSIAHNTHPITTLLSNYKLFCFSNL